MSPVTNYDVIVAGGGAGGVGAALGAARCGARVLLVEKYGFLGGAATASGVLAYCGLFQSGPTAVKAVAGAADLVISAIASVGADTTPFQSKTTGNWLLLLDPEVTKLALDTVLVDFAVEVLHHTVAACDGEFGALRLSGIDGMRTVTADAIVDATGDAAIAFSAGVTCRDGDGSNRIQPISSPIRIGGLPTNLEIDRDALSTELAAYSKSGCFPVRRKHAGFIGRIPGGSDIWWMIIDHPLPCLTPEALTQAERHTRAAAKDYVEVMRRVPGCENAYLLQTGPQVGIRESRHPEAITVVDEDDLTNGRLRDDGIARAAWPMENHSEIGRPKFRPIGGIGYAHIPLGALRARGHERLFYAGRVIGSDPISYGSIRVMGTAFATGEAAGVAAAMPGASVAEVRAKLTSLGALI